MKNIVALAVLGILFTGSPAVAVLIGNFPGFDELVAKADAVVILRVDHHVDVQSSPTLYTTHDCYICQTLKGDVPSGETVRLQLMDTRTSFVTPYAIHSTHLMFLTKKRTPNESTEYRTIEFQGANIQVSPFGNEEMPAGDTVLQQITTLLRRTIDYNREVYEKEQAFLKSAVK